MMLDLDWNGNEKDIADGVFFREIGLEKSQ
jgi:hypothetical protein